MMVAMDAWDPWLGGIARRARRGKAWKKHAAAWACNGMAYKAWTWAWEAQQPNLAGSDDPAWRSRNTGDGQEGGQGKREREQENQRVHVYSMRACRPIRKLMFKG